MCSEDQRDAGNGGTDEAGEDTLGMGTPGADAPSPDAFRRNLAVEMPRTRKTWLVARNNFLKIAHLDSCCGHPGEPGC